MNRLALLRSASAPGVRFALPFWVLFLLVLLPLLVAPAARAQHALAAGGPYDPAIPTPQSVLGYELGEDFTAHHLLMRYLERLTAASPRVRLDTVAVTHEGREVVMVVVTSEANHRRLDQIQADARRIADPRITSAAELDAVTDRLPVIVWLGYTVHGPEASGVEAAIGLLYQLAAGQDAETTAMLDRAVVLIDPVQNPDGHERHVQDVHRMRTAFGVPPDPAAMAHWGTWPGPRTNHYYFDMNRDWFTQSQPETRGRVRAMLQWYPHVAVDLHEMSYTSTYFFPPAMDPINALIDPDILRWWDVFAVANRAAFDREGWSYFRREGYDEFYPGFGDSWPIFNGSVGMTYEQASSRGGAIRRDDGSVLTLAEAARHHYAAAWATLTTAVANDRALVRDYLAFRRDAVADAADAPFRAVVLAPDDLGRADSLAKRLIENGIEVGRLRAAADVRGAVAYDGSGDGRVRLPAGSYVVDFAQPQGRLARAILEPEAPFDTAFVSAELDRRRTGQESQIYDVTAWSMPFAYNVRAWGVARVPGEVDRVTADSWPSPPAPGEARYAYAFAPGRETSMQLLSGLLADSVRVWFAPKSFRAAGRDFPHGAFLVRVATNGPDIHVTIRRFATRTGAEVTALNSAGVDEGTDLGSGSVVFVRPPRVAILAGTPVSGQSFGATWYTFDQRLRYPTTPLDAETAAGSDLDRFDVLVIPSASGLHGTFGSSGEERIAGWVRRGGVLITMDSSTEWLATEGLGLTRLRPDTSKAEPDSVHGAPLPADVPGAIVRARVDTLNVLAAGIDGAELPVLVFSDHVYATPDDVEPGEVVVRYAPEDRLWMAGYLWPEVAPRLAGTPYLWTESAGRGRVIGFAEDPNFRDQWRGLLPLFANAVFLGGL